MLAQTNMRTYTYIIYVVLAWTIQLCLTKQSSYTSYVELNTEQESGCDSSCVALRLGLALGLGALFMGGVSIPVVCCCVYKMRQRKVGILKKILRKEGYEMVNQNAEWIGDITSETQSYGSDCIDD